MKTSEINSLIEDYNRREKRVDYKWSELLARTDFDKVKELSKELFVQNITKCQISATHNPIENYAKFCIHAAGVYLEELDKYEKRVTK